MNKKIAKSEQYRQQGYVLREQNEETAAFFQNSISVFLVMGPYPEYVSFYLAESGGVHAIGDNRDEALKKFRIEAQKNQQ